MIKYILLSALIFSSAIPSSFADWNHANANDMTTALSGVTSSPINTNISTAIPVDRNLNTSSNTRILANEYVRFIVSLGPILASLVALYLGYWKKRWERPKLKLFFREEHKYPYFDLIAFNPYENIDITLSGRAIKIYRPGLNVRIKVGNIGKSTAKNVQARVEKIELVSSGNKQTKYYHPTIIKWSGEKEWNPVDIVHQSYFFLDTFFVINEMTDVIAAFNVDLYKQSNIYIDEQILKDILKETISSDESYWNVWVDSPSIRGIPPKYDFQGKIAVHIVINAENCDPIKFKVEIGWSVDKWSQPSVKIVQNNEIINTDDMGGQ